MDATLDGRLVLSAEQRAELRRLTDAESEDGYLDWKGERLAPEPLFEAFPWMMETAAWPVKILSRYLNLETGEARFVLPDTYGGETFRWL